jgi:subtilisin family serine protease
MSSRFSQHVNSLLHLAGVGGVAAFAGCARISEIGASSKAPRGAEANTFYSLASSGARSTSTIYSATTVSFALDRIDQRTLPLDRTYSHGATGKGVTVYVFDGGVSMTHPELAGRVRIGYSGFPNDPKICNPHGTAVAGAIAGSTLGVAPDAEIVDVKMVQCDKLRGTIAAIVDGARWAIEDHKLHPGPAIANWSFIADTAAHVAALDSAVDQLRSAGIPVIVSAGNVEVDACRVSPANAKGAIVVGASGVSQRRIRENEFETIDRRSPGTAFGPCIDLYAPGDSVLLPSLDRDQSPIQQLWNGTSMAAGFVSGAAALYFEAHPTATPDEITAALEQSATVNVVRDTHTTSSRMLYVGTAAQPVMTRVASRR